jgi:phosphoenolpyruvate synthase/pyruvate phosphate dikinase
MNWVLPFSKITVNDRSRIGGKGYALAQMHREGMRIPEAIIAREYGLPCVTGVPDAAELIKTGGFITVDGHLGIVTVGEPTLREG